MAIRSAVVGVPRREPCAKCGLPVFIAERLTIGKQTFHRTCFRCARCNGQLALANYYETETDQYCCETCPDEEAVALPATPEQVVPRSLSDEEKSAAALASDEYSAMFETALEYPELSSNSDYTRARSQFIGTMLVDSDIEEDPPDDSSLPNVNISANVISDSSDIVTKENVQANTSLVQARMRLFERTEDTSGVDYLVDSSIHADLVQEDDQRARNKENKDNESVFTITDTSIIVISDDSQLDEQKSVSHFDSNLEDHSKCFKNNELKSAELEICLDSGDEVEEKHRDIKDEHELQLGADCKEDEGVNIKNNDEGSNDAEKEKHVDFNDPDEDKRTDFNDQIEEKRTDFNVVIDKRTDFNVLVEEESTDINDKDVIKCTDYNEEDGKEHTDINNAVEEKHATGENNSNIIEIINEEYEKIGSKDEKSTTTEIENSVQLKETKSAIEEEEYPTNLNPFGDEDEPLDTYEKSLNPFSDDDDEQEEAVVNEMSHRRLISVRDVAKVSIATPDSLPSSDSAEKPEEPRKRQILAPKISLNPFWSDDEDNVHRKPVATPRSNKRNNNQSQARVSTTPLFGSSTSISSGTSSVHSTRKKKIAPRPPIPLFDTYNSPPMTSPSTSVTHSPKPRKTRRAPLPPTSTPYVNRELLVGDLSPISDNSTLKNTCTSHSLTKTTNVEPNRSTLSPAGSAESGEYEKEKVAKDEVNRNRQSQSNLSPVDIKPVQVTTPNKSTYGKWKRKKGQAPTRPVVQKRTIRALPMGEVRRQFDVIEIQLQGLERQGVRLEEIIRERCEGPETDPNSALSIESEDLILQLFEVVNEKNELCRQKAELMYLQRQHRLEEEHAEVEYQIRCLMQQPEVNKTDSDKTREEELINRLVDIVERRNEIIECLEMDRLRETEEDDSICNSLNTYASKRDESGATVDSTASSPKKKEKKKFRKRFKLRSSQKVDMDKDVDESESSNSSTLSKDKRKKKFNLF